MRPLKIAVSTIEPGLAEDLARSLADRGKGLLIKVAEAPETCFGEAEVLVTDFDEKIVFRAGFGPSEVVWLDEECLPVSRLYEKIMDFAAEKRYSAGKQPDDVKYTKHETSSVISFFSRQGGSGVTVLAVTLGRMLAGMYGEKVLYVCMEPEDHSVLYRNGQSDKQKRPVMQELQYRLERKRPICMERFTERDMYGLEYLCSGNEACSLKKMNAEQLDVFLKAVGRAGDYRWILLDAGSQRMQDSSTSVEIRSQKDCRSRSGRKERQAAVTLTIWNRCGREQVKKSETGEFTCIPEDPESFLTEEDGGQIVNGIEICMTKSFASAVRSIAAQCMNDTSLDKKFEPW